MGRIISTILIFLVCLLPAEAQENISFFNFTVPETLNPSIPTPGLKESVPLDGKVFTQGDVSITFHATGTGNTQVRLYGSYDAGCNLRVYDGDSFIVETLENVLMPDNELIISEISFDVALSGTVPDVDLIPNVGEYDWMNCIWTPGETDVKKVTFVSNLQSRISNIRVTLTSPSSGISGINPDSKKYSYWTLDGQQIRTPLLPGLYIVSDGTKVFKIIKK